ncbi:basic secretory protein-like protein [Arcticibacter tournemirensis]
MRYFDLLRKNTVYRLFCFVLVFFLSGLASPSFGQYFGQNKVRYKNLKFKVNQSPHFELYYYLKNDSLVKRMLQESELWYDLHQQVFRDTFSKKNPLIVYNNHADFQQTTAIDGDISVGTGGVTEGMKNRVVMPMMQLNQQTRHVLGHELVHAFQYHSLIEGDSTNLENIGNLPLWMVEGMAEYLSIGKVDAFTAMWMRDAYLNKDIPTLRDLTESNRYFPYRYGQAFWTYIGSTYGDTIIVPLFKATAKFGYQMAIRRTFGYDERTLSNLWRTSIENTYKPLLKDTSQVPVGRKLIDSKNGGDMNVAPAISPDGKYVAFLSEKELFSIDLFLADAVTGKIIRKLTSKTTNTHIDEFSFIESAGAWSPDSKKFAFTIYSEGRNKLLIVDVSNGKVLMTEGLGDVREFSNLAWSPNGEDIALTGLKEGFSDLYLFNTRTKQVTQLTNDKYSDYQPNFSSDGRYLVFTSDRTTFEKAKGVDITYNLAVMDLSTKTVTDIPVFNGANNMNPQFSSSGGQIYFLSNRDGFRNLYRYTLESKQIEQLTDYFTGISGITEYSPALSVSRNDDVLYSYYRYQKYTIFNAKGSDFKPVPVAADAINFDAGTLPPIKQTGVDLINANLSNFNRFETITDDKINPAKYRPQFKLDYLSSNGVGASVGRFGTGLSSGIQGIFSDILGRNQIFATLAVNGEIYDFGGQVAYVNQQSRINYGGAVSHIPYVSGYYVNQIQEGNNPSGTGYNYVNGYDIIRTFEDQVQAFAAYPFSRIFRFEAGTGASYYSYRIDRWADYYQAYVTENPDGSKTYQGSDYYPFDSDKHKLSKGDAQAYYGTSFNAFTIYQLNAAFVGDNSYFGVTSPLSGFRFRLGIESYIGDYNFNALTADFRKYTRIKPVTLAARLYSYTRFGKDQQALYPLFIGYPYLIRGYEANSFYRSGSVNSSAYIDQLSGSKIAVGNFEVRLPFTGPEKLAAFPSKFLFSDLNLFFDIGLAYNSNSKIHWTTDVDENANPGNGGIGNVGGIGGVSGIGGGLSSTNIVNRAPSMSAGVSLRVNMFGYFVLEPYFAIPFSRKDVNGGVFGLTFAPGW